jgi:hypothetical protein
MGLQENYLQIKWWIFTSFHIYVSLQEGIQVDKNTSLLPVFLWIHAETALQIVVVCDWLSLDSIEKATGVQLFHI